MPKLPAFALPFVTRSLRGSRGKRYLIFSLLMAVLTGVVGLWFTFGVGHFERSLRVEFGLEQDEWEREHQEFTVYVHSEADLRRAQRTLAQLEERRTADSWGEVYGVFDTGQELLERASQSLADDDESLELRHEARQLTGLHDVFMSRSFPWHDLDEVEALRAVIEHRGVPGVALYRSPLGFDDALAITGFIAGVLLLGLATVFAPLLVAVQQAQERHENTLMPLIGTALSPRELVMGLALGPISVIAIFAIPQLAIFLICSAWVGEVLFACALLIALLATTVLFTFGAQLIGHLFGQRRTPGVIGISLMLLAGIAWLVGVALTSDADRELAGFAAVFPHIGLSALLVDVFMELNWRFHWACVATYVWTCGTAILSWLTVTALTKKIEESDGPLLGGTQTTVGVLTCIVLVNVALPRANYETQIYAGLGMLALPLFALLMSRVPVGDGPARMRDVPVTPLLLEFMGWILAHIVFASFMEDIDVEALHPIAIAWLTWSAVVLGLVAIRIVSLPGKLAANLWAGFCVVSVALGFAQAVYWGAEGADELNQIFALSQLSPVLGLLQIALAVWIPLSLSSHLRNNLGSIR